MKRKVVKHGSNTLTVSLPAKWAKWNNIKAGDELEVEDRQNFLAISSKNIRTLEKKTIDTTNMQQRIADQALCSTYIKGYNEVEIIYDSKEMINFLTKITHQTLLGYEIFYQSDKRCVIKNISTAEASQFNPIMRKNFQIISMLADESLALIREGKYEKLSDLLMLERTNNKFTNYLLRILNVSGFKSHQNDFFLFTAIRLLERVADVYKQICTYLPQQKLDEIKISRDTLKVYETMNDIIKQYSTLYFSYNINLANKIYSTWQNLSKKIQSTKSKNVHEIMVLNSLVRLSDELDALLFHIVAPSI